MEDVSVSTTGRSVNATDLLSQPPPEYWQELYCIKSQENYTAELYKTDAALGLGGEFCNTTFDTVLCWPTTPAGTYSYQTCPQQYGDYMLEGIAQKYCYANSTWNIKTDYSACSVVQPDPELDAYLTHNTAQRAIYFTGYIISTVALVIALSIFLHFRALKCLRNSIHCHLIVTFILKNIVWIILHLALPKLHLYEWPCKLVVSLYSYLNVTNFFWMLVEGIYLLFMVVWAYSTDKFNMYQFIFIGWAVPSVFILIWSVVKYLHENENCWLNDSKKFSFIYIGPVLAALLINLIILIIIIYILVTKLRATNCAHSRQSRKAIRATLILFPLLGLTYILYLVPYSKHHMESLIFQYINAILQSFQGLEVAVFYCFLNGEVKSVIKSRVSQWQEERSVATKYTRASVISTGEDGALHSPNHSIKSNGLHLNQSGSRKLCSLGNNELQLQELQENCNQSLLTKQDCVVPADVQ